MNNEPLKHINVAMTEEQRREAAKIRQAVREEFPPKTARDEEPPPGIPRRIHDARKQRGLTRYAVAQIARVPSTVVRAIERGEDVPMSQFHAVAGALGLIIELVEQT